jgi:hypothetical protein
MLYVSSNGARVSCNQNWLVARDYPQSPGDYPQSLPAWSKAREVPGVFIMECNGTAASRLERSGTAQKLLG